MRCDPPPEIGLFVHSQRWSFRASLVAQYLNPTGGCRVCYSKPGGQVGLMCDQWGCLFQLKWENTPRIPGPNLEATKLGSAALCLTSLPHITPTVLFGFDWPNKPARGEKKKPHRRPGGVERHIFHTLRPDIMVTSLVKTNRAWLSSSSRSEYVRSHSHV